MIKEVEENVPLCEWKMFESFFLLMILSAQTHTTKFNASVVLVENTLDSFNQSCTHAAIT